MSGIRARNSLYSGIFLLLIAGAVATLVGMLESFAVRSGRSIVRAVLDEARTLRQAADEFGAGHLDYRLPVRGKDEFSVVAASFNQMAMNLERQRRGLIETERLEEDLAVAREIQRRFLRRQRAHRQTRHCRVLIPSKEVGASVLLVSARPGSRIRGRRRLRQSVPAALYVERARGAAGAGRRSGRAGGVPQAHNRLIIEQIEPGRFVTLFYGEADPATGTLHYVSAGHNPALVVGNGGIAWLREGGVPLGILPQATYQTARCDLAAGDTVIAYSDGVTEAERPAAAGSSGTEAPAEMFGEERLAAALGPCAAGPLAVVDGVLQAVRGSPASQAGGRHHHHQSCAGRRGMGHDRWPRSHLRIGSAASRMLVNRFGWCALVIASMTCAAVAQAQVFTNRKWGRRARRTPTPEARYRTRCRSGATRRLAAATACPTPPD